LEKRPEQRKLNESKLENRIGNIKSEVSEAREKFT
jgi:hypothetical protein